MLDIGWTELLLIGIVALIVVGPRDLPKMFRALGQFTAKARGMAREFQRAMESAADESGVNDIKRDFRDMASGKGMGLDDVEKSIGEGLDPDKAARAADRKKAGDKPAAGKSKDTSAARDSGKGTADSAAAKDPPGKAPPKTENGADKAAHGPETAALLEHQKAERARRRAEAKARTAAAAPDAAPEDAPGDASVAGPDDDPAGGGRG